MNILSVMRKNWHGDIFIIKNTAANSPDGHVPIAYQRIMNQTIGVLFKDFKH